MPEYTLNININDLQTSKEQEKKNTLESVNNSDKNESKNSEQKELSKLSKGVKVLATLQIGQQIANTAVNAGMAYINTIGAREDNVAKQNRINNMMNVGGEVVGTVSSVVSAGVLGSSFGPIGAAVGAVTALVFEVSDKLINIVSDNNEFKRQQTINTLESVRNTERLGRITTNRNR